MGGRGGGSSIASKAAVPSVAQASPADMVRQAYVNALQPGKEWVLLPEIREELAGMGLGRQAQDAAIEAFALQRDTRVVPMANLKALRPQDRAAAIKLGGELKHAIMIDKSS